MDQTGLKALRLGMYLRDIVEKTLSDKTDIVTLNGTKLGSFDDYVANYRGMWQKHHYDTLFTVLHSYYVANAFGSKRDIRTHIYKASMSLLPDKEFVLTNETEVSGICYLLKMANIAMFKSAERYVNNDLVPALRYVVEVMACLDPEARPKIIETIERAVATA